MGLDHVRCDIVSEKFSSTILFRPDERPRRGIDVQTHLEDHSGKLRTTGKQGLKDLVGGSLTGVLRVVFVRRIKRKAQDSKFVQVFSDDSAIIVSICIRSKTSVYAYQQLRKSIPGPRRARPW